MSKHDLIAEIIQAELEDRFRGAKQVTRAELCEVLDEFVSLLMPRWDIEVTPGPTPNSITANVTISRVY
jgi:hypothetical protein